MAEVWLHIIGLGEDGPAGLSDASRAVIAAAGVIFGGPRHLDLVGAGDRGQPWPVPFDIAPVLARRGQPTVILASGDPFWFGAGGSMAAHLAPGEWLCHPAPSTFSLAAARLGWRLEEVLCFGLHAAPFARMRPVLHQGGLVMATLRDGDAPAALAAWLVDHGFGGSRLHVLERLGGPAERVREATAEGFDLTGISAPVAVAIRVQGQGLSRASGLDDALFATDGQITKRPFRALTLSALAPRAAEVLWDLGAGSGSVSVEWCLAGGRAVAVEVRPDRVANIRANAAAFGIEHRLTVVPGDSAAVLGDLPIPDAVFVGGGGDADLLARLINHPARPRLVVNTVTLETEALVIGLQARHGGDLMRFEASVATPLGRMRGWTASRPVVQWSLPR